MSLLGAAVNLNHPAHVVHWHFIVLSVSNIVVIAVMFVAFFAAILLPLPGSARRRSAS